jgi:TPR repeat protein
VILSEAQDGDVPLEAVRQAAEAGDVQSMLRYAGHLVRSDPGEARRWFERAASTGDVQAMVGYAYRLQKHHPEEARQWYERAAEAGSSCAMGSLGHLVYAHDPEAARQWWERAADGGNVWAMRALGQLLSTSDRPAAELWLRRAAEGGDAKAKVFLAKKLRLRHPRKAARLFDQAAQAGDPDGLAEVGNRIVRHHLLLVFKRSSSKAFREAIDLLTPAAEGGSRLGMRELASLLIAYGRKADGERWLQKLAGSGDSSGSLLLGLHQLSEKRPDLAEEAFAAGSGRRLWPGVFLLGRLVARRMRKNPPVAEE